MTNAQAGCSNGLLSTVDGGDPLSEPAPRSCVEFVGFDTANKSITFRYLAPMFSRLDVTVRRTKPPTRLQFGCIGLRRCRTIDAVVRNLEILGEAAKRVSDGLRERAPGVPWRQVTEMRDVLARAYFGIDVDLVIDIEARTRCRPAGFTTRIGTVGTALTTASQLSSNSTRGPA